MPSCCNPPRIARIAAAALAAAGLLLAGRRVAEIAADPSGEKDCGPEIPAAEQGSAAASAVAADLPWTQRGGTVNDASCLNRTAVAGVIRIAREQDVADALTYARAHGLKVSIAGVRHSMGGQAFARNALMLDMRGLNAIALDAAARTVTVGSGATWHDIQKALHPKFAVKAMQSTDIFTVGGSVSVNAHGMDHNAGALGRTIRSMRVMLADGTIKTVGPAENTDLFRLVLGGYGLFGVVLDVTLDITDNAVYETGRQVIAYQDFPKLFDDTLARDPSLGLFYGHLSTSPDSLLREMLLYTYKEETPGTQAALGVIGPLGEVASTQLRRFVLNFSKLGALPMRLKWLAEKYVEPRMESCTVSRNQAMASGEACLVSRNEPMHDSVAYLRNDLKSETDILQEYFIPRARFVEFVDGLREVTLARGAVVTNASVRVVHREDSALSYAPADAFSVVLYVNQGVSAADNARMRVYTSDLIDLSTRLGGRFFLPYQLHYSAEQLTRAYPELPAFFAAKRARDPQGAFTNTWYERFGQ